MPDKIVYFSVYDPICEVLRGSKYTSRDEADRALAWWKSQKDSPAAEVGTENPKNLTHRWDHLELAIVTIERLPDQVRKVEASPASEPEEPEKFQTE